MTDQGLEGNEKIEEHIGMLQREPSPEMLAVTLSFWRMKESGGWRRTPALRRR